MVTLQTKVREKLQSKVFAKIGKSVAYKTLATSTTYDERGDMTGASYATSTITIVPYNITKDERLNQIWGTMNSGSLAVAIPYTATVSLSDVITIDGDDYRVDRISPNDLPDNVVTICMLNKVQ